MPAMKLLLKLAGGLFVLLVVVAVGVAEGREEQARTLRGAPGQLPGEYVLHTPVVVHPELGDLDVFRHDRRVVGREEPQAFRGKGTTETELELLPPLDPPLIAAGKASVRAVTVSRGGTEAAVPGGCGRARNDLDELCLASPAVAGDKLLIRTASKLTCLTSSSRPWFWPHGFTIWASAAHSGN